MSSAWHVEQLADVVIANVFEVPASAGVRGDSGLPSGCCAAGAALAERALHGHGLRDIRKRQALGGKADAAPPRIVERPPVGADAVVVAHAGIDMKGQETAARRHRHPDCLRGTSAHKIGEEGVTLRVRDMRRRSPSIAAC